MDQEVSGWGWYDRMTMVSFYEQEAKRLGKHIRCLRRGKDITQEQLAEALQVSVSWVSRIERGKRLPNLKLLFRMALILQVSLREMFL